LAFSRAFLNTRRRQFSFRKVGGSNPPGAIPRVRLIYVVPNMLGNGGGRAAEDTAFIDRRVEALLGS
jgi:hypothetical protein